MMRHCVSLDELNARTKRLQELMRRDNFEALVAYATCALPGNVRYFTNFAPSVIFGRNSVVMVVLRDGAPSLLINSFAEFAKGKADPEAYPTQDMKYSLDYAKDIGEILSRMGVKGKIGVGGMYILPALLYRQLIESLPGISLEDAQDIIDELRWVKSPSEINSLRRAAAIADRGMEVALNTIAEGKTEHDIGVAADHAMRVAGAESFAWCTGVASGDRSILVEFATSRKVIKTGETVVIDVGPKCEGYFSDMSRTKVCGRATQEQKDLFEIVVQIYRKAVDMLRPGVRISEVHEAAERVAREAGYTLELPVGGGPVGHGVGLELGEGLRFRAGEQTMIGPNMVFALEPGLYLRGVGGVRVEDTFLVTDSGSESLNKYPIELS